MIRWYTAAELELLCDDNGVIRGTVPGLCMGRDRRVSMKVSIDMPESWKPIRELAEAAGVCSVCIDGNHEVCRELTELAGGSACRCPCRPPNLAELYPDGKCIYYEGDDPEGFRATIIAEFRFDPACTEGEHNPGWVDNGFVCPPEHLGAIYGSNLWPMGS